MTTPPGPSRPPLTVVLLSLISALLSIFPLYYVALAAPEIVRLWRLGGGNEMGAVLLALVTLVLLLLGLGFLDGARRIYRRGDMRLTITFGTFVALFFAVAFVRGLAAGEEDRRAVIASVIAFAIIGVMILLRAAPSSRRWFAARGNPDRGS